MNESGDIQGRPCGCAWRLIPASELPDRMRSGRWAAGVSAMFTRRCAAHRVMCRVLEDWELDMLGGGER